MDVREIMSDTDANHQLEHRLTAIERNHLQLQKDVSGLARDISALTQAVQGITNSLRSISDTQTTTLRTNWSVVFAGVGIAVMVAGLVVYQPLTSLTDEHRDHVQDGHPKSVLDKIMSDEAQLKDRLDRKQEQFLRVEERLDEISSEQAKFHAGLEERILDMERALYPGVLYRSGRPISTFKEGNSVNSVHLNE